MRNALSETFTFAGADCEALTNRVLGSFSKSAKGVDLNSVIAGANEGPTKPAAPAGGT